MLYSQPMRRGQHLLDRSATALRCVSRATFLGEGSVMYTCLQLGEHFDVSAAAMKLTRVHLQLAMQLFSRLRHLPGKLVHPHWCGRWWVRPSDEFFIILSIISYVLGGRERDWGLLEDGRAS